MPRFYEEAAHLLLVMLAHGAAVSPRRTAQNVLEYIAMVLERQIASPSSHIEDSRFLIEMLDMWGYVTIDPARRSRLETITGVLIGNIMTMQAAARKSEKMG